MVAPVHAAPSDDLASTTTKLTACRAKASSLRLRVSGTLIASGCLLGLIGLGVAAFANATTGFGVVSGAFAPIGFAFIGVGVVVAALGTTALDHKAIVFMAFFEGGGFIMALLLGFAFAGRFYLTRQDESAASLQCLGIDPLTLPNYANETQTSSIGVCVAWMGAGISGSLGVVPPLFIVSRGLCKHKESRRRLGAIWKAGRLALASWPSARPLASEHACEQKKLPSIGCF